MLLNVLVYYVSMILSYQLTAEGIMYKSFGGNGEVAGAGFVEANIWLPYYRFAPYIILAAVVLAIVFLWRRKYKLSVGAVLAVPAIYICVVAVSIITQQFAVAPDERNYQTPYIKHNMDATKHAFGLDNIREVQFDFEKPLIMCFPARRQRLFYCLSLYSLSGCSFACAAAHAFSNSVTSCQSSRYKAERNETSL